MDLNAANLEQDNQPENDNVMNSKVDENNMAALLEQEGVDIDFPRHGETRQGVVASVSQGQILVSVGTKSEGIISGKEYDLIPAEELEQLEVGQEIPVYVINPEDSRGNLVLSFVRAREEVAWQEAEEMLASKVTHKSSIIGYNKGGLLVPMSGLRGFVPASQISLSRRAELTGDTPEQRWSGMVGEDIEVCVIEVDRERRRLIFSERAASSETRETLKEKVIDNISEGDIRKGRVTSLADFGAFVNISGADGLVHLSEISWERIQKPDQVLKVGQEVDVKVISIDRDKRRIGLSIRQLLPDPWAKRLGSYKVGQLVEATITRLTKFGAFASLEKDLEGLIHISEISEKRIDHPKEVLKEGDEVTLRVIKIEPAEHRIGLSLRKVDSMAYADMDWQTLLEEELLAPEEETPEAAAEVVEEAAAEESVAEVVEEAAAEEPVAEVVEEAAAEEPVAEVVEETAAEETPAEDSEAEA